MATYTLYGNFGSDVRVILKVTLFDLEHNIWHQHVALHSVYINRKCQIDKTYGTLSGLMYILLDTHTFDLPTLILLKL